MKHIKITAFTLVELLIVISIISILALIAIPNFGDAQIRAKVAATKSNMRNVAIKFEMQALDTNRYPLAGKWRWMLLYKYPQWVEDDRSTPDELLLKAYDKMYGPFEDPFEYQASKKYGIQDAEWPVRRDLSYLCHGFNFFHPPMMLSAIGNDVRWQSDDPFIPYVPCFWGFVAGKTGDWVLYSPGPDLTVETPQWLRVPGQAEITSPENGYFDRMLFHVYDPTNGTVSYGNIFRSQRDPSGFGTYDIVYEFPKLVRYCNTGVYEGGP